MVATLVNGPVEAGTREVRWNGRTDRGDPARDGIYFVRCQSGDRIVSQKIALMRAR
jgi:hypothetical protein